MSQAGHEPLEAGRIGLSTSQTIGLCMVFVGVAIYALRRNAGVDIEIPYDPDED